MNNIGNFLTNNTNFTHNIGAAVFYSLGALTIDYFSGRIFCWLKASIDQKKKLKNEYASIVKIQALIRGKLARKHFEKEAKHALDYDLFLKAVPYTKTQEVYQDLERARDGKTPVYFIPNLPVVLKLSGSPTNQKRFEQMKIARELCEKNQFTHLIIPKARVVGSFIIESRLPLLNAPDLKVYLGFYLENKEKFTAAVREFTRFLCLSTFHCIVDKDCHPYTDFSLAPIGRYDNVSIYIDDDGVGKIGLVDLERFKPEKACDSKKTIESACLDAIDMFPCHFDVIIEEVAKFYPQINYRISALKLERDQSLKLFEKLYIHHDLFLKKHHITIKNPTDLVAITKKRRDSLKLMLAKELQEKIKSTALSADASTIEDLQNCQDFNVRFSKLLDQIVDNVITLVKKLLKEQIEHCGGKQAISNHLLLLAARSIIILEDKIAKKFKKCVNSIANSLSELNLSLGITGNIWAHQLIIAVLKEMKKGGEIANFKTNCVFDDGDESAMMIFV